jgi:Flp pilus assembly protein TadB
MRWLLIVLLVSLAALLFASAGVAYHIWRQRIRHRSEMSAALESAEDIDLKAQR